MYAVHSCPPIKNGNKSGDILFVTIIDVGLKQCVLVYITPTKKKRANLMLRNGEKMAVVSLSLNEKNVVGD